MDIVESVIGRLEHLVFPVSQESLRTTITSMVKYQVQGFKGSELDKQVQIEIITRRYMQAIAKEREPVGVNAALTTGESLTQSSLQSHHHAGLKRGAGGFDRIEELTDMKNRVPMVRVITLPVNGVPRSKFDVNELSNILTKVYIDDIRTEFSIERAAEGKGPVIDRVPKWYRVFSMFKAIPTSSFQSSWLRVHLNPDLLYRYRIPLYVVASRIEEVLGTIGAIVYPPTAIGTFIDIHIGADIDDASKYSKLGTILSLQVGGIDSVDYAYPISENLLTNFRVEEAEATDMGTVYEVKSTAPGYIPALAWSTMIQAMVPDAKIVGNSGRRFISARSRKNLEHIMLRVPMTYADVIDGEPVREADGSITYYFRENLVEEFPYLEHAILEPQTFQSEEEASIFLRQYLVEKHLYWYIEASCSKVQDLFMLKEVDSMRTFTTSPMDCMESLGYLAMRQMLYQEFRDNIGVDSVHVKTIVNNMTLYKNPVSIRRKSLKNDKSEFFTYTTFEEVMKYVANAAFAGEEDHMRSVSSQIITGQPFKIGRGGDILEKGNVFVSMLKTRAKKP